MTVFIIIVVTLLFVGRYTSNSRGINPYTIRKWSSEKIYTRQEYLSAHDKYYGSEWQMLDRELDRRYDIELKKETSARWDEHK